MRRDLTILLVHLYQGWGWGYNITIDVTTIPHRRVSDVACVGNVQIPLELVIGVLHHGIRGFRGHISVHQGSPETRPTFAIVKTWFSTI
jgi:hypothetical protein